MRVLRFIGRQVRFLLIGSKDVSASNLRLSAEMARWNADQELLRTQILEVNSDLVKLKETMSVLVSLDARISALSDHADNVTSHLSELTENTHSALVTLDARVAALHEHADNVLPHLRELTENLQLMNTAVGDISDRLVQVEASDMRHRREMEAIRSGLRIAVDDLGDRVTQLTVRLNEL